MKVEIWSDVVCPWCFIGKRRFESALERFPHKEQVEVTWRSFELDPSAPPERQGELADHLAVKYGMSRQQADHMQQTMTTAAAAEGLTFDFSQARSGNTFDAHRLLHLAAERGVQDAVKERLLTAYFSEGEPIGDPTALVRMVEEAGLDGAEAKEVLAGEEYAEDVRAEEADAQTLGISGASFFVVS
ncbi:MAG: DsbA family oxidoreductase, partial [Egibacteraceae bacterium]